MFRCQSICLLRHSLALKGCHYGGGKKGAGTGRETSLRLLSALFIINYVCIIVFLLPALEKKLKRAIVFLIPRVESIYHAAARRIGHPADRD